MRLLDLFDRIVVINLPARTDRKMEMENELEKVNSSKIDYFPAIRPAEKGGFESLGARGCFLSHLAVLKKAHNDGVDTLLIFEDDAHFLPTFFTNEEKISALLKETPWGILYLGYQVKNPPSDSLLLFSCDSKTELLHAHAVAFTRQTLTRLVPFLEALLLRPPGDPEGGPMPIDGAYNTFRRKNSDCATWIANPPLLAQRSSKSDITPAHWFDHVPFLYPLVAILRKIKRRFSV